MAAKTTPETEAPLSGQALIDAMVEDPEKHKAAFLAECKEKNPKLSDAQLEEHWKVMVATFF